jgi:hypothetical protein
VAFWPGPFFLAELRQQPGSLKHLVEGISPPQFDLPKISDDATIAAHQQGDGCSTYHLIWKPSPKDRKSQSELANAEFVSVK